MYVWVVARLPQRLKSMFFSKNFLHSRYPSLLRTLHSKNVQKMLILVFEATSALSGQNGFFPSFSSLCLVRKKFLLILPLQAMRTNAIFFYYRLFKMNFYFQIWFQTKKKIRMLTCSYFLAGSEYVFLYFISKNCFWVQLQKNASRLHNDIIIRLCALKTYNAYLIDIYIYMCNIVERCLYNLIDHLASKLEADRYAIAYAFISLINFIVHNRTQGESERVGSEQNKIGLIFLQH